MLPHQIEPSSESGRNCSWVTEECLLFFADNKPVKQSTQSRAPKVMIWLSLGDRLCASVLSVLSVPSHSGGTVWQRRLLYPNCQVIKAIGEDGGRMMMMPVIIIHQMCAWEFIFMWIFLCKCPDHLDDDFYLSYIDWPIVQMLNWLGKR